MCCDCLLSCCRGLRLFLLRVINLGLMVRPESRQPGDARPHAPLSGCAQLVGLGFTAYGVYVGIKQSAFSLLVISIIAVGLIVTIFAGMLAITHYNSKAFLFFVSRASRACSSAHPGRSTP